MADEGHDLAGHLFTRHNARVLLNGKYILLIGDSVQRCAYKDLVALLEDGCLLSADERKDKLESSFKGDTLLARTEAHNGTNFSEIREWVGPTSDSEWRGSIMIRFVFTTRVFNQFVEETFKLLSEDHFPDVVCVNSTFWDISRYGDKIDLDERSRNWTGQYAKYPEFEERIKAMMKFINDRASNAFRNGNINIPCKNKDRIWRNALPIGRNARGGLLIPEIQVGTDSEVYRADMSQANLNIKQSVRAAKWNLLDGQFFFRKLQGQAGMREKDGIHWNDVSHRWLTNIFLSHICVSWKIKTPEIIDRGKNSKKETVPNTIDTIKQLEDPFNDRKLYSCRH